MLNSVDVGERAISAYRGVAHRETLDEMHRLARELRGARVLHLNATPYGGGVSELLRSVVPLLNDLGLVADWKIITGDPEFFAVTKIMHNALQGGERGLTPDERALYERTSRQNASLLEESYDFVFVHDPQPAAILSHHGGGSTRWVWRCHIDTAKPNPEVWQFLRGFLSGYHAAVFTMAEFVPPDLPVRRLEVIPPAIDPLSPKNRPLDDALARDLLGWLGVSADHPLVTQVSRFDAWKDPLGVIAAYRFAREDVPGLHLALVGSMALDDPEAWEIYDQIQAEIEGDPRVHVLTNLTGVGNIEVNAFQRLSSVVVQKSLREGFGLVVSEAMWKGTPVVAGRAGGIPLQMADGAGGILIDTVEQCAKAICTLLQQPDRAAELAQQGRDRVRKQFLLPRLLLNELSLMWDLLEERPVTAERSGLPQRDPVCGMVVAPGPDASLEYGGTVYSFCSSACRERFRDDPQRYTASAAFGAGAR